MLRERLYRLIIEFSYYNLFLMGLLPAPLDRRKQEFRSSRIYLTYSCFAHIFCMVGNALSAYYFIYYGFGMENIVLKWTYIISNLSKVIFIIVLIKEVWCKRKSIVEAYNEYCALDEQHGTFLNTWKYMEVMPDGKNFEKFESESEKESERKIEKVEKDQKRASKDFESGKDYDSRVQSLKCRIRNLILVKFVIAHITVFMSAYIFFTLHSSGGPLYPPITSVSFILNSFMLSVSGHFFFVLSLIYQQYAQINFQLRSLYEEVKHQEDSKLTPELLACRINSMATLHLECYRLTQRIFGIGEFTLAAMWLRLFFVNIRTVYSTCLLLNSHHIEVLRFLVHDLVLTAAYFGDTAMVMAILDAVLKECNYTGQVLREYVGVVGVNEADCLRRALDSFAAHLSCHKLRYKVCGLFEFNKEAALQFFLMVLVKVSVLVQFDMQNKLIK